MREGVKLIDVVQKVKKTSGKPEAQGVKVGRYRFCQLVDGVVRAQSVPNPRLAGRASAYQNKNHIVNSKKGSRILYGVVSLGLYPSSTSLV